MVAKDKNDFLFQLHSELHRIGIDANEELFADFEEHFKASQNEGFTEEETCQRLGDVKEIARSYLDIESSRINSIVAQAIENDRPHVSLTKPGMDVPADLSLVGNNAAEENAPIREYTPEHLSEEIMPERASAPNISLGKQQQQQEQQQEPQQPVREFTPEHIAQEPAPPPPAAAAPPPAGNTAGAAGQSVPRPSEEHAQNYSSDRKAEMPHYIGPKAGSGKSGGFDWEGLKGRKAHCNVGKLIVQICLDVFIYSWALPSLASLIIAFMALIPGVFSGGITALIWASDFHFISRVFLMTGMLSGGMLMVLLAIQMVKGYVHIIKSIVIAHAKAVYDL